MPRSPGAGSGTGNPWDGAGHKRKTATPGEMLVSRIKRNRLELHGCGWAVLPGTPEGSHWFEERSCGSTLRQDGSLVPTKFQRRWNGDTGQALGMGVRWKDGIWAWEGTPCAYGTWNGPASTHRTAGCPGYRRYAKRGRPSAGRLGHCHQHLNGPRCLPYRHQESTRLSLSC